MWVCEIMSIGVHLRLSPKEQKIRDLGEDVRLIELEERLGDIRKVKEERVMNQLKFSRVGKEEDYQRKKSTKSKSKKRNKTGCGCNK